MYERIDFVDFIDESTVLLLHSVVVQTFGARICSRYYPDVDRRSGKIFLCVHIAAVVVPYQYYMI